MQLCFESVLKYHVFFPASNEAIFRVRKLQNKGTLTLNLPREYRTDLNLNNQEFRADNRLLLSPCRTLLNTCRSCQEVFGYKYHLVSTITDLLGADHLTLEGGGGGWWVILKKNFLQAQEMQHKCSGKKILALL